MNRLRIMIPVALSLLLAACGFSPMYSKQDNGHLDTDLSVVAVSTVRGSLGEQLRMALEKDFNPTGRVATHKGYRLNAGLRYEKIPVVIEPDGSINRYNINIYSNYTLTRSADGTEIKKGTLKRTVSYNAVESDFATYVSEQDIIRRGIDDLSEDYRLMLGAYFRQMSQTTTP